MARRQIIVDDGGGTLPSVEMKTAHWPSGPADLCPRHLAWLEKIADAMGIHVAVTPAGPNATCSNCSLFDFPNR